MTGHSTKVVVFTFLVTVVACVPQKDAVDVTLLRYKHNELKVRVEWGNEGMRMQIEAKPNQLLIRSSANGGGTFFYGEKKVSLGTFYSALGRSFFTMDSAQTQLQTDYLIPSAMNEQAKQAFQQRKIDRMASLFDREDVQSSTENTIRELTHRPEVRVLEETAHTLGERGVTGRDNRGALLFYTMVLQLVRGRDGESTSRDGSDERDDGRLLEKRQLPPPFDSSLPTFPTSPSTSPSTSPTTPPSTQTPCESHTCTNPRGRLCENCHHDHECPCGLCPLMPKCLGMCGFRCFCWRFVCGDCCYWDGCYQHDLACRDNFISLACLLPFNFTCNGYGTYMYTTTDLCT